VRPLLAGRALGPADSRAVDADPQAAVGLARRAHRRLDRVGVGDVRLDEPRAVAELSGERLALLGVEVRDHDVRAAGVEPP
jgi:hypothetical protein